MKDLLIVEETREQSKPPAIVEAICRQRRSFSQKPSLILSPNLLDSTRHPMMQASYLLAYSLSSFAIPCDLSASPVPLVLSQRRDDALALIS